MRVAQAHRHHPSSYTNIAAIGEFLSFVLNILFLTGKSPDSFEIKSIITNQHLEYLFLASASWLGQKDPCVSAHGTQTTGYMLSVPSGHCNELGLFSLQLRETSSNLPFP